MNGYFAGTSYFVAYLNPHDINHDLAVDYFAETASQILTNDHMGLARGWELPIYLKRGIDDCSHR